MGNGYSTDIQSPVNGSYYHCTTVGTNGNTLVCNQSSTAPSAGWVCNFNPMNQSTFSCQYSPVSAGTKSYADVNLPAGATVSTSQPITITPSPTPPVVPPKPAPLAPSTNYGWWIILIIVIIIIIAIVAFAGRRRRVVEEEL